ncbi:MAG: DUF1127 domain-containing protein [Xanthobacteraceae bacterium]|nr:DUF1127 domain-containing protein [Xanthobacteraceae bacterium]
MIRSSACQPQADTHPALWDEPWSSKLHHVLGHDLQAFREYNRNLDELSRLSDRELADIGLDRSDIQRVAAGSYNG